LKEDAMQREEARTLLNQIFRSLFDDESLSITEQTTAKDVSGWDSLNHMNLIVEVEKTFGIKMTTREVQSLKNAGDLITIITNKAK